MPLALVLALLLAPGQAARAVDLKNYCVTDVGGNSCTANDVTFVTVGLGTLDDGCVSITDTTDILLRAVVANTSATNRYDIGMWVPGPTASPYSAYDGDSCYVEGLFPAGTGATCSGNDLTCGSGPYLTLETGADVDSCGDLLKPPPDCGRVCDPTVTGACDCTQTDSTGDDSVKDYATAVTVKCEDSFTVSGSENGNPAPSAMAFA